MNASADILEIVEISHMVYAKIQNGIFHSNGYNFASRKDFLASPEVLESRSSRLHDAQKNRSIRPLGVKEISIRPFPKINPIEKILRTRKVTDTRKLQIWEI